MLLDDLRAKRDAIFTLGDQYGAKRIRVFGSVARCEERPDSDVDFPRGYDLFSQCLSLTERLAEKIINPMKVLVRQVLHGAGKSGAG